MARPREIPLTAKCIICSVDFPLNPYRIRKTCSNECLSKYRHGMNKGRTHPSNGSGPTVDMICKRCSRHKLVYPCQAKSARFCSNECRLLWFSAAFKGEDSPHWLGGAATYYGPNWKEQKRKIRKLNSYTCQVCGKTEEQLSYKLCVAHLKPFRSFGIDNYKQANCLNNLICLCKPCHASFDRNNGTTGNKKNPELISVLVDGRNMELTKTLANRYLDFGRTQIKMIQNIKNKGGHSSCNDCGSHNIVFAQI